MLTVTNIKVHTFDLDWLDVYWEIEDTYEDVDAYDIYVLKSEAEEGPYHIVAGPFENKFHFRDTTARLKRRYRNWWYRIRLVNKADQTTKEFPDVSGATMRARPDFEGLEMARQEQMKLGEFNGRRVVILPTKTFGQKCKCWDPNTDQVVHAPCVTCFGTRYVGGYHTPIIVPARIVTAPESTNSTRLLEAKQQLSMVHLADFPLIKTGWLIIEPGENLRWRVGENITVVQKLRFTVRQMAPIASVPIGDVSYKIPVNIDDPQNFEPSPPRQFSRPSAMTSIGDEVYIGAMGAFIDNG